MFATNTLIVVFIISSLCAYIIRSIISILSIRYQEYYDSEFFFRDSHNKPPTVKKPPSIWWLYWLLVFLFFATGSGIILIVNVLMFLIN